MNSSDAAARAALLAEQLRRDFLHKPFGIIQFWRMGVVPPNDQSFELVSTHADGDRLDLVFVHASRAGLASVLSVWDPAGLEGAPGDVGAGIAIRAAHRVRLDTHEATARGEMFHIQTPRGEGTLPQNGAPALILAQ